MGVVTDIVTVFRWAPSEVWRLQLWELGHWGQIARAVMKKAAKDGEGRRR